MKAGRHRIGNAGKGRNDARHTYSSVDLDPMLFLSSDSTGQPRRPSDGGPGGSPNGDAARHNGHSTNGHGAVATATRQEPPATNGHSGTGEAPATPSVKKEGLESRLVRRVQHRFPAFTRRRARLIFAVLAVLVLVVVVAAGVLARSVLNKTPSVVVTTAAPAVITNQPGGVGTLAEAPNNSFTVSLNLAGIQDAIFSISQVDVTNGAPVSIGTPLVQIDPTLLVQNAAQFQSQLNSAQQSLNAALAAPAPDATAQALQIATLTEQVTYDRELVAIAQGRTTTVTSPASGFVTGLVLQPGQVVTAGQAILEVINPAVVDVSASLLLTDMRTITTGDSADVAPSGLPGVHLHGTVLTVSPISTAGGLDGTVVIQAQNTSPNPVPIGTQVFVHVKASKTAAVSVPGVAVMNSDLQTGLFIVRNGRAHFQPVTVGASDARRVEILSGLRAGQTVIESNMQSLTDGEKVRVLADG
jgi:membrane fusion protein, multidrug efflux system